MGTPISQCQVRVGARELAFSLGGEGYGYSIFCYKSVLLRLIHGRFLWGNKVFESVLEFWASAETTAGFCYV